MAGFNGGASGGASSLLYNPNKLPQPFFLSSSSSSFLGSSSMMSFEDVCGVKRSERPFYCTYDQDENGEDDYDDYLYQPEKKRRLTGEQVQFLEKSFEVENKLEPERKIKLAKDLGLQPRQVAIWFQNRRARWKTKRLEKDFDSLQSNYNTLKSDYDRLLQEKEKLQAEVVLLTDKLLLKEKRQKDDSEPSNTYVEPKRVEEEPNVDRLSESEDQAISVFGYKQEDLNSVKSDVIDSESSPRYVDASHSSLADSSAYAFEADHSDISQDDQDYLSNTLLMPSTHAFFKITDVNVDVDPPPHNSCNYYTLPGEDHHHYDASLFWPY